MIKPLLQLKVVRGPDLAVPAPRLCDLCANSAILRGHARGGEAATAPKEEVICLFLGRVIEIDVTECNRFVDRFPPAMDSSSQAAAETAWVA